MGANKRIQQKFRKCTFGLWFLHNKLCAATYGCLRATITMMQMKASMQKIVTEKAKVLQREGKERHIITVANQSTVWSTVPKMGNVRIRYHPSMALTHPGSTLNTEPLNQWNTAAMVHAMPMPRNTLTALEPVLVRGQFWHNWPPKRMPTLTTLPMELSANLSCTADTLLAKVSEWGQGDGAHQQFSRGQGVFPESKVERAR